MSSIPHHQDSTVAPTVAAPGQHHGLGFWRWLGHVVPTVLVVVILASLAAWGHLNEWKMPKFSALVGNQEAEDEAWCEEHAVSGEVCIECKPDLLPLAPNYGWCQVHGVAQCPLEHPDVAQLKTPAIVSQ